MVPFGYRSIMKMTRPLVGQVIGSSIEMVVGQLFTTQHINSGPSYAESNPTQPSAVDMTNDSMPKQHNMMRHGKL